MNFAEAYIQAQVWIEVVGRWVYAALGVVGNLGGGIVYATEDRWVTAYLCYAAALAICGIVLSWLREEVSR